MIVSIVKINKVILSMLMGASIFFISPSPVYSLPDGLSEGEKFISAFSLEQQVNYLASDQLAGRETGMPGIVFAEEYIAQIFRQYGLKPLPGKNGFFIEFNLFTFGFNPDQSGLEFFIDNTINQPALHWTARSGLYFKPFDFSAAGTCEAEVIFAGYGITAPEYNYDDYSNLDVKSKIVLILRHEPHNDKPDPTFNGTNNTVYSQFDTKAKNALAHGASGLLLVDDPVSQEPGRGKDFRFARFADLNSQVKDPTLQAQNDVLGKSMLLAVHVSPVFINTLLASSKLTISELQAAVDKGIKPVNYTLPGLKAHMHLERYAQPQLVKARNVAGLLSGTSPAHRNEYVVVGAHHDHVGSFLGTGDTIYNGADDNASGVATVLTLVQAFSRNFPRPERSLYFITFSAEEMGLFGSRALLEQNLIPSKGIVFMYNVDMVGRNPEQPLVFFHSHLPDNLDNLITSVNKDIGLNWQLTAPSDRYLSDYWPFSQRNIPTLFVFAGDHPDYHQVTDEPGKLNYVRMEKLALLSFRMLNKIVNPALATACLSQ